MESGGPSVSHAFGNQRRAISPMRRNSTKGSRPPMLDPQPRVVVQPSQGLPMVGERGDEQGADCLAAAVVPCLRCLPPPVQAAEESVRGIRVLAQHHRGQLTVVSGPPEGRVLSPARKVHVPPDPGLEPTFTLPMSCRAAKTASLSA